MKWIGIDVAMLIALAFVAPDNALVREVWPLAMAAQMGWFAAISKEAIRLKANIGTFPWRERLKIAPFGIALIAFAYVGTSKHIDLPTRIVGVLGIVLSTASKLWLFQRPIGGRRFR